MASMASPARARDAPPRLPLARAPGKERTAGHWQWQQWPLQLGLGTNRLGSVSRARVASTWLPILHLDIERLKERETAARLCQTRGASPLLALVHVFLFALHVLA